MVRRDKIAAIKKDKTGREYVSNPLLLKEIIEAQKVGRLNDAIIEMFSLMVENIQRKKYYKDPQDREDCSAVALMDCVMYWERFDPTKSNNPFAYFTSVIVNGIAKGWNKLHPENKKADGARFISLDNNIHNL